jgi:hypothetical protein
MNNALEEEELVAAVAFHFADKGRVTRVEQRCVLVHQPAETYLRFRLHRQPFGIRRSGVRSWELGGWRFGVSGFASGG